MIKRVMGARACSFCTVVNDETITQNASFSTYTSNKTTQSCITKFNGAVSNIDIVAINSTIGNIDIGNDFITSSTCILYNYIKDQISNDVSLTALNSLSDYGPSAGTVSLGFDNSATYNTTIDASIRYLNAVNNITGQSCSSSTDAKISNIFIQDVDTVAGNIRFINSDRTKPFCKLSSIASVGILNSGSITSTNSQTLGNWGLMFGAISKIITGLIAIGALVVFGLFLVLIIVGLTKKNGLGISNALKTVSNISGTVVRKT